MPPVLHTLRPPDLLWYQCQYCGNRALKEPITDQRVAAAKITHSYCGQCDQGGYWLLMRHQQAYLSNLEDWEHVNGGIFDPPENPPWDSDSY